MICLLLGMVLGIGLAAVLLARPKKGTCDTCEFYARTHGVCCNTDCKWQMHFTARKFGCEKWEETQK